VLRALSGWTAKQRADWRTAAYKSMGRAAKYKAPKTFLSAPRKPRLDPSKIAQLKLLSGTDGSPARAVFRAESASDVAAVLELAKEFELRPVILGGRGLLEHAQALLAAGVPVVLTELGDTAHRERGPLLRRPSNLSAQLVAAGLEPALGSGSGRADGRHLRLLAAREVGRGLRRADALKGMTLWAARAAGVGEQQGSLTPGKRADVVVWSGDPLSVTTRVEHVIVGGREMVAENADE
jgi:imidazolonepropionase-like amidohydrolase